MWTTKRVDGQILALAVVLGGGIGVAPACGGDTASGSAHGPVSSSQLPRAVAEAICTNIGPCCQQNNLPLNVANCEAFLEQQYARVFNPSGVLARGLRVLALVIAGAIGCSESDGGVSGGPEYSGKDWVCCLPDDGGAAAPAGWCECVARKPGLAIDCFGRGVSVCPATPRCVVQGSGADWSCECSNDGQGLSKGNDVYAVETCPPK